MWDCCCANSFADKELATGFQDTVHLGECTFEFGLDTTESKRGDWKADLSQILESVYTINNVKRLIRERQILHVPFHESAYLVHALPSAEFIANTNFLIA